MVNNQTTIRFAVLIFVASSALEAQDSPGIRLLDRNERLLSLFKGFDSYDNTSRSSRKNQRTIDRLSRGMKAKSTAELRGELKEDPYSFGYGPIGRALAARGQGAADQQRRDSPPAPCSLPKSWNANCGLNANAECGVRTAE